MDDRTQFSAEVTRLLDEVEPLAWTSRARRMIELGRQVASGSAEARGVVAALRGSPEAWHRMLAVMSIHTSRDGEHALAALADTSRSVRRIALRLVPRVCDDAQLTALLAESDAGRALTSLVKALHAEGRSSALDAALPARLGTSRPVEPRDVDLLAWTSATRIEAHLALFEERASEQAWITLARLQPGLCATLLRNGLARVVARDARLEWRISTLLLLLVQRAPDEALDLLGRLFARGDDPARYTYSHIYVELVRRRPAELFDLLRARHESGAPASPPGAFGHTRFDAGAHRLGTTRLQWLVEHAWTTLSDGHRARRWFLRLPEGERASLVEHWLRRGRGSWGAFLLRSVAADGPLAEAREQAYQRWSRAAQNTHGVIGLVLLAELPRDLRVREARRHLDGVEWLTSRPRERMAYARLLPFDEAQRALAPWLGHPEGEERAAAMESLLASLRFDRANLPAALAAIHARRFEQDPVRMKMLQALVALPPECFGAAHLESVGLVLDDALDAADCSSTTAAAVEQLVVRLFRLDPSWGTRWLTRVLATRGQPSASGLGDQLSAREVGAMAAAVGELAMAWTTKERASAVLWLATSFGQRVSHLPLVLDSLERLARELPFVGVAASALGKLRVHAGDRFRRLVPELLALDPSYIIVGDVARYVSTRRQDLLAPFLGDRPMKGRFASGHTSWIIDFDVGYACWTAAQQRLHATSLAQLIGDEKRDVPSLRSAISRLARLGWAPPETLIGFASDRRQPVREMAVRALPWLDAGQGVPTLIECLGDGRARWAIYALRKELALMPRARVLSLLRAVPRSKVTVAKEVIRLLGELGGPGAYDELLAMERSELHRDVRIALLRALWDHLDRAETWTVFERSVEHPDWVVASRLADLPLGRLTTEVEARVVRLLVRLLARPEPEARLELLTRAAGLPLSDGDRALFRRCVEHMGAAANDEAAVACRAALARMRPTEVALIAERITQLGRRRPRLVVLLDEVLRMVGPYAPPERREVAARVMDQLAGDPLAVGPYLRLLSALADFKVLVQALGDLSARQLLHADAMVAALAAVRAHVHPTQIEQALRAASDPNLRRLALEALRSAASPEHGWTAERRAQLRGYRGDAAPLVAEAAHFTFPPDDEPFATPPPPSNPPSDTHAIRRPWWKLG